MTLSVRSAEGKVLSLLQACLQARIICGGAHSIPRLKIDHLVGLYPSATARELVELPLCWCLCRSVDYSSFSYCSLIFDRYPGDVVDSGAREMDTAKR
jgi:hypothetical protein